MNVDNPPPGEPVDPLEVTGYGFESPVMKPLPPVRMGASGWAAAAGIILAILLLWVIGIATVLHWTRSLMPPDTQQ